MDKNDKQLTTRSTEGVRRRKESKRKNKSRKRNHACSLLSQEKEKVKELEEKLQKSNKRIKVLTTNKPPISSVSRNLYMSKTASKSLSQVLPNQSTLSANVIVESEEILGEGTFGVVKVGFYQTLGVKCAIKVGKNSLFNAKLECQIMQRFHGSLYFPFVFGVFDNKLVMELIVDDNDNVKTIYSARSSSELEQHEWIDICKDLAEALFFLHSNGFLHNDIKRNLSLIHI